MRNRVWNLLFLLILTFLLSRIGFARVRYWTDNADVICVASVSTVEEVNDGSPKFKGTLLLPMKTTVSTLKVTKWLKGEVTSQNLSLELYHLDFSHFSGGFSGSLSFSDISKGQSYLIFAKKIPTSNRYRLVDDPLDFPSLIAIKGALPDVAQNASPLVYTLNVLLASFSVPQEKGTTLKNIDLLGDFGDVLWEKAPLSLQNEMESIRQELDYSELQALVKSRVIPQVLKLTKFQDEEVRVASLVAAAKLQQPDVIPQLASIDDPNSLIPTMALSSYRTSTAIPTLLSALKDATPKVKENIIYSLGAVQDTRSVPFLLDALEDSNIDESYRALFSLYEITGKVPPTTVSAYPNEQKKLTALWKEWTAKHTEQLDALRAGKTVSLSFSDIQNPVYNRPNG